jgi:hypothetical protein
MNKPVELLPTYDYPVDTNGGLDGAAVVIKHWRANIDRLLSLSVEERSKASGTLEAYVRWLIRHAVKQGSHTYWNTLSEERMPSDARSDFIKQPTCIALANLNILQGYLQDNEELRSEIDQTFISTTRFITNKNAWQGNGYDMYDSMCVFLNDLSRGGVIQAWVNRRSEFEELVAKLIEVSKSMSEDPERWCGKAAGYYSLDVDQLNVAKAALAPLIGIS